MSYTYEEVVEIVAHLTSAEQQALAHYIQQQTQDKLPVANLASEEETWQAQWNYKVEEIGGDDPKARPPFRFITVDIEGWDQDDKLSRKDIYDDEGR